uniref:Uncharacterized protein n=1 Tax=Romanomermis culicivorax TaxID=13658 RepID=A0A915IG23_ROMCU
MRQTLSALKTNTSAQGHGLPTSESDNACIGFLAAAVVSALIKSCALPPSPPKYVTPVNVNPSMMQKTTGDISVVALMEGTPAPPAHFATQGLLPGIPTDSTLEVVGHMGSMNLLVNAVCHAVQQASCNTQPTAVVAALPKTTMMGAQTLAAIAQQQPVATTKLPPTVANIFRETLRAINNNVSIIEASPFPTATASGSPKIGVLRKVHLVMDFPGPGHGLPRRGADLIQ